jgi:hypothetical protein
MGLERSGDVVPTETVGQPGNGEELARAVKPFGIAKRVVWEAYRQVKANRGAAGIEGERIEMFEANLRDCHPQRPISEVVKLGIPRRAVTAERGQSGCGRIRT